MSKSRRPHRPFVRPGRNLSRGGRGSAIGGGAAAELAHSAGAPSGIRSSIESLEPRKLLFSITITDDPDGDGIGTATATFAYVIPFIVKAIPAATNPQAQAEEFQDETAPWTALTPPVPPSGTFFSQSGIRLTYSTISTQPIIRVVGPDTGVNGQLTDDFDLQTILTTNDSATFGFFETMVVNPPQPLFTRLVTQADVTIGGLDIDAISGSKIELLRDGVVVGTLRGAQLAAARVQVLAGGLTPEQSTQNFRYTLTSPFGFDSFRISSSASSPDNNSYFDRFYVDDITQTFPSGRFAQFDQDRIFGATVVLTGPIGATAEFLDLYGRQIRNTLALGVVPPSQVALVDRDDNGIPDFNDGIGRINLSGVDGRTSLTMLGGTVQLTNNVFTFQLVNSVAGLYDDFESAGFGFTVTNATPPAPTGLPPGTGSLIIGAPFVRDNTDPAAYLGTVNPNNNVYTNPNQGIFVAQTGHSIGSLLVHGMIFGSSQIAGAAGRVNFGNLYGSLTVQGDLGSLYIAGDAGAWTPDQGVTPRALVSTQNELFVGRTAGDIAIGGRSLMDVTIAANINDPSRATLNFYEYHEREWIFGIDPAVNDGIRVTNNALLNSDFLQQASYMGTSLARNDLIAGAEFVGYNGSAVHITGDLGFQDPVNRNEDPSDVYAFAADGTTDVVINLFFDIGQDAAVGLVRVVDAQGRVLASHQSLSEPGTGQMTNTPLNGRFVFRPDHADVYYLTVNVPNDTPPSPAFGIGYELTITGMAATTLGAYRTGAAQGGRAADPPEADNVLQIAAGNLGSLRIGSGFVGGDGALHSPADVINSDSGDIDDQMNYRFSSTTVAGNLYSIWTGSDVVGAQVFVGGNLGSFITGQSTIVGVGITEGDLDQLTLDVGGSIGTLFVSGAVGWNQDPPVNSNTGADVVNIRTGRSGNPGNIGSFLIGNFMSGQALNVVTSARSTIDRFIVGASPGGTGQIIGRDIANFTMGVGSDVRFVDFSSAEGGSDPDVFQPLAFGQTLTFSDDSGGTVSVRISGAAPGQEALAQTSFGEIRLLPITGSLGSALARIDVTLNGGAVLEILGTTPGVVSVGRINVTTDDTGGSQIIVTSNVTEIDVGQITQTGAALGVIRNNTPHGDFVSIDVAGLGQLLILNGDLGRTQVSGVGPRLLGPFLGIARGLQEAVGGALGINGASIDPQWNGNIFLPINFPTAVINRDETLEDLGSPLNGYLNGLVVRGGNVTLVQVAGAVGDVILQGAGAVLTRLTANSDGVPGTSGFDGIVGTIYARDILNVDVGDGLVGPGDSPMASAGIFADDDIVLVGGRANLHPVIRGLIVARDVNPIDAAPGQNGLVSVSLVQGRFDGAFMGSTKFDEWWQSARFSFLDNGGDDLNAGLRGPVNSITGVMTDLFRSRIVGDNINLVNFTTGAWDASSLDATGSLNSVIVGEIRNSTILGEPAERRLNEIRVSSNIGQISANGSTGDISDLLIDARGSLTGSILARNLIRGDFQIDGTINNIFIANDMRSSNITAGRLTTLNVTNDIRASEIDIAGPITTIIAGSNITNTHIITTGPDGRIDTLRTRFFLTGVISSSGTITSISSTEGDIIASISTTSAGAALTSLSAGRDLIIETDIAADVGTIMAGRHIGELNEARGARVINIRGNLNTISAPNGQIYSDLRVAQAITGTIRTGRVAALPGNDQVSRATYTAYGRIAGVDLHGDFNGSLISESGGIGIVRITDGSFRPGNVIRANDGSIDQVIITGGHLLGSIIAEEAINSVIVAPGANGFWGDMGINPGLSQFAPFDALRNQLPPGVAPDPTFQGPRIQAGTNIGLVDIQKASMWESSIVAGNAILRVHVFGVVLNDNVTPGLGGSFFIAGDSINSVDIEQFVGGAIFAAGVTDLGADNRPGGTGANADTVQFGRIGDLTFRGGTGMVSIAAGMNAGPDGFYTLNPGPDGVRGTADDINDDAVANGLSAIGSVTVFGQALQTTVYADNGIGATSTGLIRGGPGLHQAEPNKVIEFVPSTGQVPLAGLNFTTTVGETGRISLTGPGQAYFEQVFDVIAGHNVNRLALINTTLATRLIVDVTNNNLTDFHVLSNDGSSLGFASIRANLQGDSSFYFDGYVQAAEFGALNTTGSIGAGNDIGSLTVGPATRGTIDANHIQNIIVGGNFGLPNVSGEAVIRLLSGGNLTIGGNDSGLISVKRDLGNVQIFGGMINAELRSGRSITSLRAASLNNAKISARNDITTTTITGDVTTSALYAGTDLGADGTFGGTGANADVVTNGSFTSVTINGNFTRSDIAAGVHRGPDAFLGTPDDFADEGHSSIGSVTIGGTLVGSPLNSESYRIVSNGSVGSVRVNNQPFTESGNFAVRSIKATPNAFQVADLRVDENARVYTARIEFNQPVVRSTLSPALNIFEVRQGGQQTVRLAENIDYILDYDAITNSAVITFSQALTGRDLPQINGQPGPGVYRFTLDAAVIRGQTQNAMLDGNSDGIPQGANDDYSADAIVGDAGDKIDPDPTDANNGGVVLLGPNGERVDYYFAADLDVVLDNNFSPDGLPDVNQQVILRGTLGDHADHNTNFFPFSSDYDLYKITLRAGQILRLGKMLGVAQLADRQLLDANGNILFGTNAFLQELPANPPAPDDVTNLTVEQQFLIRQTGTYYIAVAAPVTDGVANDVTTVPTNVTTAGAVGPYHFSLEIFDDGDSGFAADTNSGDGVNVVNAPTPSAFPTNSNTVVLNGVTFNLNVGGDGVRNTFDDVVSGSNGSGIFSQRTAGPDGVFGSADDAITSFVDASIGAPGATGASFDVSPDVDVYRLNNGDFITPGTRVRATLQLTELGSNLGLTRDPVLQDLRGTVQFAIFDITNSNAVADGSLVAAPSVSPIGGKANTISSDGVTSYGYDANGDFFIDLIIPAHQGTSPGKFALYVQGSIRSDYQLQITTQGTGTANRTTQNLLIETRGGVIDWLEAGGISTNLGAFKASVLGFSGLIDGQTADNYIINNLIANLQAVFAAANVSINVSADPAAFQGQDFSTVFVTGSNEPIAFFDNGTYGAAEHADAFNVDHNDQGVVFLPAFGNLGYSPGRADIDLFTQSLTAAVSRRVGELVGLRMLNLNSSGPTDVMSAESVRTLSPAVGGTPLPGPYRFSNQNVDLSPPELLPVFVAAGQGSRFSFLNAGLDRAINTDFFLGQQNSVNLLDRLLLPPG